MATTHETRVRGNSERDEAISAHFALLLTIRQTSLSVFFPPSLLRSVTWLRRRRPRKIQATAARVSGFSRCRATCVSSTDVAWVIVVDVVYSFEDQPPSERGFEPHFLLLLHHEPECGLSSCPWLCQSFPWYLFPP